jgi:hypothetical protein
MSPHGLWPFLRPEKRYLLEWHMDAVISFLTQSVCMVLIRYAQLQPLRRQQEQQ